MPGCGDFVLQILNLKPGCGNLALERCRKILSGNPGCETWLCNSGCGNLDCGIRALKAWLRSHGFGILAVET